MLLTLRDVSEPLTRDPRRSTCKLARRLSHRCSLAPCSLRTRVQDPSGGPRTSLPRAGSAGIAAVGITTADLGSDGGVIDGCARVHWRGRAMFPAAGDGSGTFVFRRHLRRSLHVYCAKVRFSGACPLVGVYLVAAQQSNPQAERGSVLGHCGRAAAFRALFVHLICQPLSAGAVAGVCCAQ